GALPYDVASLLYDAKADLPDVLRTRLLDRYLAALALLSPGAAETFFDTYRGFVLVRIMQAMGAYGYRGFFERKPRFLQSVPFAARNVAGLLEAGVPIELPELERVFQRVVESWAGRDTPIGTLAGLTVHITSFS